ncbi:MAG TPA: trypsin-like peptidase domain-containing protein [Acidimicrobiia bacterium]|nr:trypsin-like peptidase domain-containing protein [Acidimicrobiia bacterium]
MTIQGPDGPEPMTPIEEPMSGPVNRPRRFDPWTLVLGILGGALLGTGVTFAILGSTGVFEEPTPSTNPPPPSVTVPPPTSAPPPVAARASASEIAQHAIPSIVAVEVDANLSLSGGSGVVYGTAGYLITNDHVIEGADTGDVTVVFADGARYPAEIIGTDPLTDVAVLHVDRADLTPMDVGDPAALRIGDMAVAIGNPLALVGGPSVTSGIVSALDRSLEVDTGTLLYGLVQTDAPITHGSSGGALLDEDARVIGITTAIAVSNVAAEGFGFAIPIDMAIGVADDLIESGVVNHAQLGIRGDTYFAEEDGARYPVGVLVDDVTAGSAYELSGGLVNDVIVSLDGVPIETLEGLLTELRRHRAGEESIVSITRSDGDLDLTVTLGRFEP